MSCHTAIIANIKPAYKLIGQGSHKVYVIMGGVFLGSPVINDLLYLDGMRTFESFTIFHAELSLIGARLVVHGIDLVLKRCVFLEGGSNMLGKCL